MTKRLECMVDLAGEFMAAKSTSLVVSDIDLRYLVGILNSRLVNSVFENMFGANKLQGGYLRIGPPQLRTIPIRTVNLSNRDEKVKHDRVIEHVVRMLHLCTQLAKTKTPQERMLVERERNSVDAMIDRLVYDLYGVTDDEIAIIEGGLPPV